MVNEFDKMIIVYKPLVCFEINSLSVTNYFSLVKCKQVFLIKDMILWGQHHSELDQKKKKKIINQYH